MDGTLGLNGTEVGGRDDEALRNDIQILVISVRRSERTPGEGLQRGERFSASRPTKKIKKKPTACILTRP